MSDRCVQNTTLILSLPALNDYTLKSAAQPSGRLGETLEALSGKWASIILVTDAVDTPAAHSLKWCADRAVNINHPLFEVKAVTAVGDDFIEAVAKSITTKYAGIMYLPGGVHLAAAGSADSEFDAEFAPGTLFRNTRGSELRDETKTGVRLDAQGHVYFSEETIEDMAPKGYILFQYLPASDLRKMVRGNMKALMQSGMDYIKAPGMIKGT